MTWVDGSGSRAEFMVGREARGVGSSRRGDALPRGFDENLPVFVAVDSVLELQVTESGHW
jgi:hypothetical protein